MTAAASASGALPDAPPDLIYVIEDDEDVARLIAATLRDFGFVAETFRTGSSMLRRLQMERPDLCIVDLGLPDMDGMELVRQLLRQASCGVLILTGRGHTVDRVMGLELGGDDYVVKPFEPRELVARVRSILRRRSGAPASQRRYASFLGWTFDGASNLLRAPDGSEHMLSTAETQLLRSLVERPHQILSREQLMGTRDLSPLDRSIDVRISRLRRKIESDPQNPKIIKTIYGAGYMLCAGVTWS
jgi:DNA-binding response OmpR family regulator